MSELQDAILRLSAKYDCMEELHCFIDEDGSLRFHVKCNDLFAWAVADGEDLETLEDVKLLEEAILDVGKAACKEDGFDEDEVWRAAYCNAEFGCFLYCARKRKCRPQGAFYGYFPKSTWHLFDDCGPEREVGMFNPRNKPSVKIDHIRTVSFLDALYELLGMECEELGIEVPERGVSMYLPDGRRNIKDRLWDEISGTVHGNQRFSNDSLFRVYVNEDDGCELSDDMKLLKRLCRHAINKTPCGAEYIVFDVSW